MWQLLQRIASSEPGVNFTRASTVLGTLKCNPATGRVTEFLQTLREATDCTRPLQHQQLKSMHAASCDTRCTGMLEYQMADLSAKAIAELQSAEAPEVGCGSPRPHCKGLLAVGCLLNSGARPRGSGDDRFVPVQTPWPSRPVLLNCAGLWSLGGMQRIEHVTLIEQDDHVERIQAGDHDDDPRNRDLNARFIEVWAGRRRAQLRACQRMSSGPTP